MALTRRQILIYLREVGKELSDKGLQGEILIVGGAFMALVLRARTTTKDVDAVIASNPRPMCEAIAHVAQKHSLAPDWMNDAAKGFIKQPPTHLWAEYPGLRVYMPGTDYMFAMKADSARPADKKDLIILKNALGLKTAEEAMRIVERYIPPNRRRIQTQLTIETLFN
jgi:predicted nucleotidyltransferase